MTSSRKKRKAAAPARVVRDEVPVVAMAAPESRPSAGSWKHVLFLVLLIIAGLAVYWIVRREVEFRPIRKSLEALARLPYQGAEKQVVEKVQKLVAAVKADPSSADAWGLLGMNLDVHDMKNEASMCYDVAARLNPADYRWPYYRAMLAYERNPAESISRFEEVRKLRPNDATVLLRYAQALLDSGRMEEAATEFQAAAELDPGSSHAYLGMARIALAQGKLEDARGLLERAIGLNPNHGEAHGLMAELYRRLNEPQKSAVELQISRSYPEKNPVPDEAATALMNEGISSYWHDMRGRAALQAGEYETAAREMKLAAEASGDPLYYDTLGVAYLYQRKYREAAAAHKKSLELNPASTAAWNNLAAALFELGQHDQAFDAIRKAIQIDSRLAYSYVHLAALNLRSGNMAGAVDAYRSGLEQVPLDSDLALGLAWLRATSSDASIRNGSEAVALAESVVRRNADAETLDVLAAAYAEAGHYDMAVRAAQEAIARSGSRQAAQKIEGHLSLFKAGRPYRE